MESDTIPTRNYWLDGGVNQHSDHLISLARKKQPWAVLGSQYEGGNWDMFRHKLPMGLLAHLNGTCPPSHLHGTALVTCVGAGNAFYNVTHPLMVEILRELQEENDISEFPEVWNLHMMTAFDVRIAEIMIEAESGVEPFTPHYNFHTEPEGFISNTERFRGW